MAHESKAEIREFSLPLAVIGPVDVGRLLRELETLDNSLRQLSLREGGKEVKMPDTSKLMDSLIETNKLNLLHEDERKDLAAYLKTTREHAPVLHISFSSDPSPSFTKKLTAWLRQEIHPAVLLTIGLQPNIGAGCLVRTTNKYFDFSLRENFTKNRELLMASLREEVAA